MLQRRRELCCNEPHILTCKKVKFNLKKISKEKMIIFGISFIFTNEIEPHGLAYKNELGDEAIISFNAVKGNLFGSISTHDGKSFSIEKCKNSHMWKEFNMNSFHKNIRDSAIPIWTRFEYRIEPLAKDEGQKVTYSIMAYFTHEAAKIVEDIEGWLDLRLADVNQAYLNSKIPLRVERFCTEITSSTVNEKELDLEKIRHLKGDILRTKKTADAVVLFTYSHLGNGLAYVNSPGGIQSKVWSFSVMSVAYAQGSVRTLAHELGHNFGCNHNDGHLVTSGNNSQGVNTIMAYATTDHWFSANYYANPDLIYPPTGTPLGVAEVSDCARIITENRIIFSAQGDEGGYCKNKGI